MRIALFMATNIAVLVVVSLVFQLFGLEGYLDEQGVNLNLGALLIFSAVVGFTGSFISLMISKWMALRATKAQVIKEPRNEEERWLVNAVAQFAEKKKIGMPDVAIYESPEVNAFATGANRNKALVAVSRGLLQSMTRQEAEAVMAHEVAHVANGDMITMSLLQGVINTFVIFFSRIAGFIVDRVILKNERGFGIGYYVTSFAFQILFGILASVIVSWFSRRREFRADSGAADLTGSAPMIAALQRLQSAQPGTVLPAQMQAFGIRKAGAPGMMAKLFSTHPPLELRIQALQQGNKS